jgi:hypothetical protein
VLAEQQKARTIRIKIPDKLRMRPARLKNEFRRIELIIFDLFSKTNFYSPMPVFLVAKSY